ncbi:MAG: metal ABC transporter permease [Nitrososphaerota archaeon]
MQRAFLAGLVAGFILPFVGCFIVPKRLSLLGDSSSHFVLASVALGALFGFSGVYLAYVVVIAGVFVALRLVRGFGLSGDQVLAILLSLSAAVASVAISRGARVSLGSVLFGSVLAVGVEDVVAGVLVSVFALVFVLRNFGGVLLYAVGEELARVKGVNVGLYEVLFALVTGLAVAVSVRVVGVLLVTALIVIPVMAGGVLVSSMRRAILFSVIFGEVSLFLGVLLSYFLDISPGAATVFVLLCVSAVSLFLTRLGIRL